MDEDNQQLIDPAILRAARFRASRLAGRFGFARDELRDIEQELLVDYLARSRSFDAKRCTPRTFARMVFNHRTASLIHSKRAACRDYRRTAEWSRDLWEDAELQDRADTATSEHRLNLRLDVERRIQSLPPAIATICRLLIACDSAAEAAALAGISRATLYRRLQVARVAFRSIAGTGRGHGRHDAR